MLTKHRRTQAIVVMAVVLAVCLASSAACVASQSQLLRLPLPFGYMMSVCGYARPAPARQMGIVWMSPYFSAAIPPFGGPANGCLIVPWLPILPQRGELVFPP